jgi:hypothetical protein
MLAALKGRVHVLLCLFAMQSATIFSRFRPNTNREDQPSLNRYDPAIFRSDRDSARHSQILVVANRFVFASYSLSRGRRGSQFIVICALES